MTDVVVPVRVVRLVAVLVAEAEEHHILVMMEGFELTARAPHTHKVIIHSFDGWHLGKERLRQKKGTYSSKGVKQTPLENSQLKKGVDTTF